MEIFLEGLGENLYDGHGSCLKKRTSAAKAIVGRPLRHG
jgi:hypothetical protein